jgi:hypothetical protein
MRRPLPSHLPRVERIVDLSDEDKARLGDGWTFIGYDSSEQLALIPRQSYVIVYKRAKYVVRDEDVPGAEVGVKIAPRRSSPSRSPTARCWRPSSPANSSMPCRCIGKSRCLPEKASRSAARPSRGC